MRPFGHLIVSRLSLEIQHEITKMSRYCWNISSLMLVICCIGTVI